MALKLVRKEIREIYEEDNTVTPNPPVAEPDEKYPVNDYRKNIVKPQGGDDLALSSSWNSNGDSCLPYIFENSKGWKVLFDLDEENAIKNGLYIVRLKIYTCPIILTDTDSIRLKIQFSNLISEGKRFWNVKNKAGISRFSIGQDYWFDLNAELLARGLDVIGLDSVRGEILYLYAHINDYSTGKLCIRTDGGGNFKRTGAPWLPESHGKALHKD